MKITLISTVLYCTYSHHSNFCLWRKSFTNMYTAWQINITLFYKYLQECYLSMSESLRSSQDQFRLLNGYLTKISHLSRSARKSPHKSMNARGFQSRKWSSVKRRLQVPKYLQQAYILLRSENARSLQIQYMCKIHRSLLDWLHICQIQYVTNANLRRQAEWCAQVKYHSISMFMISVASYGLEARTCDEWLCKGLSGVHRCRLPWCRSVTHLPTCM